MTELDTANATVEWLGSYFSSLNVGIGTIERTPATARNFYFGNALTLCLDATHITGSAAAPTITLHATGSIDPVSLRQILDTVIIHEGVRCVFRGMESGAENEEYYGQTSLRHWVEIYFSI